MNYLKEERIVRKGKQFLFLFLSFPSFKPALTKIQTTLRKLKCINCILARLIVMILGLKLKILQNVINSLLTLCLHQIYDSRCGTLSSHVWCTSQPFCQVGLKCICLKSKETFKLPLESVLFFILRVYSLQVIQIFLMNKLETQQISKKFPQHLSPSVQNKFHDQFFLACKGRKLFNYSCKFALSLEFVI